MKKLINKRNFKIGAMVLILNVLAGLFGGRYYMDNIDYQTHITSNGGAYIEVNQAANLDFANAKDIYRINNLNKNDSNLIHGTISTRINKIKVIFDYKENSSYEIKDFGIKKGKNIQNALPFIQNTIESSNCNISVLNNGIEITLTGDNPYIIIPLNKEFSQNVLMTNKRLMVIYIMFFVLTLNIILTLIYAIAKRNKTVKELAINKRLIWNLSKNDFKTKYAGSFFGVLWAFVQPVITVLLYWFVFQIGLRSGDVGDVPFVLWLMCGLVPWFFFQDAVMGATSCLSDYSYLVKKMVFPIEILPIIKIISAFFVHLFFIVFTILIFCILGFFPSIAIVQLIYYMTCTIVLVLGIGYATSAIVVFFKDLNPLIQIMLQIGMWMTPILWNVEMLPKNFLWLMELNPMYYIVSGYRNVLINHDWIWERLDLTLNFWLIAICLYILGRHMFKKLRCHFADVL